MAIGTYQQYLAYNKKQGLNSASEDAYNKYNKLGSSSGVPVGVAGEGRVPLTGGSQLTGGFEKGVAYPNQGSKTGNIVQKAGDYMTDKTIAGRIGKATDFTGFGMGIANASKSLAGIFGSGKSNKDFEGERLTGGAEAWKAKGGSLVDTGGELPTAEQFTGQGRWLLGKDTYAHDYGRSFGANDAQYYENFKKTAQGFKDAGDMGKYNATLAAHGFGPANVSSPAPAFRAPKSKVSTPAPAPFKQTKPTQKERNEITPPAKGLEDTIKTPPRLLSERRKRSVLTSKDNRRTYF